MTDQPSVAQRAIPFHVRQGDVLLIEVDGIPDEARPIPRDGGRVVLAYGEVTGHAHAIRSAGAALLERPGEANRYLRVEVPSPLEHEEHATIGLPPGDYRVVIQREYVPEAAGGQAWRRVAD